MMNRTAAFSLTALWPALAGAQTVFFDDFTGPELLPHWSTPPAWHWDYNFNNSMLNVTDLHFPNNPHFGGNYATIGASFAPQTDFRADIWMGWDYGDDPHRIAFHINAPTGHIVASFLYSNENPNGPVPIIGAGASNTGVVAPAPAPGICRFTISRTADQFDFAVDGVPFASIADQSGRPASGMSVEFLGVGALPGTFGTFYVDRVHVVPSPGPAAALIALVLWRQRRRRPSR